MILNENREINIVPNKKSAVQFKLPYGSVSQSHRTLFTGVQLEKPYNAEYSSSSSSFLNFFSGPAGFIVIWGSATLLLGSVISLAVKLISPDQIDDIKTEVNRNKIDLNLFVSFNEGSIKFSQALVLLVNDYKFSESQAETLLVGNIEIFMASNIKINSNLKEKVDLHLIKLFNQNKITENQALQILVFDYYYGLDQAKLLLGV